MTPKQLVNFVYKHKESYGLNKTVTAMLKDDETEMFFFITQRDLADFGEDGYSFKYDKKSLEQTKRLTRENVKIVKADDGIYDVTILNIGEQVLQQV